jgi:hypothetical protein
MVIPDQKFVLVAIGITAILLSGPLARVFIWWEKHVMKFEDSFNPWIYRVVLILVGTIFISIGLAKD